MEQEKQEKNKKRPRREKKLLIPGENSLEDLLEGWTQCCFLVPRKRRLCNLQRATGSKFCPNHRPKEEIEEFEVEERVPCPLDPSHSVFVRRLEAHLKICNVERTHSEMQLHPYYCIDCNSGKRDLKVATTEVCVNQLAAKVRKIYEDFVSRDMVDGSRQDLPDNGMNMVVLEELAANQSSFDRVRHARQDALIAQQMAVYGLLDDGPTTSAVISSHDTMTASETTCASIDTTTSDPTCASDDFDNLDKTAAKVNEVNEPPTNMTGDNNDNFHSSASGSSNMVFVELGAGKGLLGLAIAAVRPRAAVVLVERSGVRRKADNIMRKHDRRFHRVRMDIRHCAVSKLPGVMVCEGSRPDCTESSISNENIDAQKEENEENINKKVVIIAKHLCGLATDLALRSIEGFSANFSNNDRGKESIEPSESTNSNNSSSNIFGGDDESRSSNVAINDQARGVAIATCCHHACSSVDYCGYHWLHAQGIDDAEFDILRQWSGWAHALNTADINKARK